MLARAEWPLVAPTGPARVIVASCHSTPEVNGCAVSLHLRFAPAPVTAGDPAVSRHAEAARWERMFGEKIMIGIQQELAQLQAEFVRLSDRWNALSSPARKAAWASFTQSLDEGTSGYHPWGRILLNAWCDGWSAIGGVALDKEGGLGPAVEIAA